MDSAFLNKIFTNHQHCEQCPRSEQVIYFVTSFLGLLFPAFTSEPIKNKEELELRIEQLRKNLLLLLNELNEPEKQKVADTFFGNIPVIYERLEKDITAIYEGDPAAENHQEVVRAYPGFYAIAVYRLAHLLYNLDVPSLPRMITEHAHNKTGIDIHPAAKIGESFCIDHGTGVVIGETTVIGSQVKLYQGVTLGAMSVDKKHKSTKRHPTIEDNVVIYSGATILGGKTVIGKDSVIGGNVWLTSSVPPKSRVYYKTTVHKDNEPPEIIIIK